MGAEITRIDDPDFLGRGLSNVAYILMIMSRAVYYGSDSVSTGAANGATGARECSQEKGLLVRLFIKLKLAAVNNEEKNKNKLLCMLF